MNTPAPTGTLSPLEAFNGSINRTKTSPLYQAGLAIVAAAMVLLPMIYMALIVLAAGAVVWHLKHDLWILERASGRTGLLQLIAYLGPAIVGGILVFFMVKPFFAPEAKEADPITLDPSQEPLLFDFVRRICGLVGAPVPCRIDVDCQVNASARLRHGVMSNDLVLTVGLPLASGLDMRQFAGVLAHEFGHFAQGAGMRLTYVIRKISTWFARVVYERDSWDVQLEQTARGSDWRVGIVLHAARGCVWVTRRILWALMHAGHAISCFMMRQMEFDADSYEAKIAGSDAFAATATRLRVLNVATQVAYEDVRQSWASSRLPENLPLLIDHKAGCLPAEIHQNLTASAASEKTGWFDTHPCDSDRVRAVQRLNERGIFHLESSATQLFSDFARLSKAVTRYQYEKHLELSFTDENLMPSEEVLRESAASSEADAMVRHYFGKVNLSITPLLRAGELVPQACGEPEISKWREACRQLEELRPDAEKLSKEWTDQQARIPDLTSANLLGRAGFKLEPATFGLPANATSPVELEIAAKFALDEIAETLAERAKKLDPFMSALRDRVTTALQFALAANSTGAGKDNEPGAGELIALSAAVSAQISRCHEMGSKLAAFTLLAQNRGNHSDPSEVDRVVGDLLAQLKELTEAVQNDLKEYSYPFPHARGRMTVAEYARADKPGQNEWHTAYLDCHAHVERLFALNYRLIGKVLALAQGAEKEMVKC